jgi:AraC-like DNA-binding protein
MTFTAWTGRLAFGPWWLLYCGPIGPTALHAHHAFQIVVHGGTPCMRDAAGDPIFGPVAVVDPDRPHAVHSHRDHALVVFIEPESRAGLALRHRSVSTQLGSSHPVAVVIGELLPDNWSRAEEAVRRTLSLVGLSEGETPMRWWRHPAVDEALLRLPDLVDEGTVDVDELADAVGMSTSRLTHVFSAEVGIPLRSYAKWLRLVRATEHLSDGASITEAAHAAGFADAAHLSRSFKTMFGLAPSDVMHGSTWIR